MAATAVILSSETSQPQERAEHDLPPKSYADAVSNTANQTSDQADTHDISAPGTNGHLANPGGSSTSSNVNAFPPANNGVLEPLDKENARENEGHNAEAQGDELEEDKVVYKRYVNDRGDHLTSVEPANASEKHQEHDQQSAPGEWTKAEATPTAKKRDNKSQLASGRRAGAGWERSA